MATFEDFSRMTKLMYNFRFANDPPEKRMTPDGKTMMVDESKSKALSIVICKLFNKVELKPSTTHGRGVFAKQDIKQGEIITLYPADIIVQYPLGRSNNKSMATARVSNRMPESIHTEEKAVKEYLQQWQYKFEIDKNYSIVGHPDHTDNPTYLGHMINDRFSCDFNKITPAMYIQLSLAKANAQFQSIDGVCIVAVATKDISSGEEVYVSYGPSFWETYHQKMSA